MIAVLIDHKGFQKTQMLPGWPQPTIRIRTWKPVKPFDPTLDSLELTSPEIVFERYRKLLDKPVEIWEYRESQ